MNLLFFLFDHHNLPKFAYVEHKQTHHHATFGELPRADLYDVEDYVSLQHACQG